MLLLLLILLRSMLGDTVICQVVLWLYVYYLFLQLGIALRSIFHPKLPSHKPNTVVDTSAFVS